LSKTTIDREIRMVALKEENAQLLQQLEDLKKQLPQQ
jgi:hypothetical protein